MQRLGVIPGARIVLEPGVRNASLLLRIGAAPNAVRLSQRLAAEILVSAV